jgi:Alpha-(1->3)-arabinofuranosyltransferase
MNDRVREASLYGIVLIALSIVVAIRLPHSGYVPGGDFWPGEFVPGNTVLATNGLWSHAISGFGSPQFNQTFTLFAVFGAVAAKLGLSGPETQFVFLFILIVATGLSTTFFARALFPERRLVALLAGVGVISMHTILWLTNPLLLFALCYYPLVAGLIISRMRRPAPWPRFAGELSIAGAGLVLLMANPPLAVFAVLWACFWVVACGFAFRTWRETLPAIGIAAVITLAESAWWGYGAYVTLFGGGGAVAQIFAGPLEWRWVDARASLLNMLSQQGGWDFSNPHYHPDLWPYLVAWPRATLYIPAAAAIFAVLIRPSKRIALLWFVAAVSALVGKGAHEPAGLVNTFLYIHLPGFWILRDPQAVASVTLYLALYTLAAVGLTALLDIMMRGVRASPARASIKAALATACAAALCASGWSVLHRDFLPQTTLDGKAHSSVLLPAYWQQAAHFLNQSATGSRILLLPGDDFYQMPYEWGFYGSDTVAQSLLQAPVLVLSSQPASYTAGSSAAREAQANLEASIETQPSTPIAPALAALGVGWILQRNDIVVDPDRNIESPSYIAKYLARQPHIVKSISFGKLDIYRVERPSGLSAGLDGESRWLSQNEPAIVETSALVNGDPGFVRPEGESSDLKAAGFGYLADGSKDPVHTARVPVRGLAMIAPFTVGAYMRRADDGKVIVALLGPEMRDRNRSMRWMQSASFALSRRPGGAIAVVLDGERYLVEERDLGGRPIYLGAHALPRDAQGIEVALFGSRADLFDRAGRVPAGCRTSRGAQILTGANGRSLRLDGFDEISLCASVPASEKGSLAAVELDHRHIGGARGAVFADQPDAQPRDHPLSLDDRWSAWRSWAMTGSKPLILRVLTSDSSGPGVNEFRAVRGWIFGNPVQAFLKRDAFVTPAGPGELRFASPRTTGPQVFVDGLVPETVAWNPLFNAWPSPPMGAAQAGLRMDFKSGGVIDLAASHNAAGLGVTINGVAGRTLRILGKAYPVRGAAPILRLREESGGLLYQSNLAPEGGWQVVEDEVMVPADQDTIEFELEADARTAPTESLFKDIRVEGVRPGIGRMVWASHARPQQLTAGAGAYDASSDMLVDVPKGARILVLREAYDRDWRPEVGGVVQAWPHVLVNGIFNGWVLPRDPPARVMLRYWPERVFRALKFLSAGGAAIALGLIVLGVAVRRRGSA